MSGDILCEFYCLGLHKRLNSSRHHVHWLASKSDSVSQGKVQSQKLPILCRIFSFSVLSVIRSCCCIFSPSNSFHVGDCWIMVLYRHNFKPILGGHQTSFGVGPKRWRRNVKTIYEWMGVDGVFGSNINFY
mgnify:CR=1 FL=1